MAFFTKDPFLGTLGLTDPIASRAGLNAPFCQVVRGEDPVLGAGEFVFAQVTGANVAGQTISSITTVNGTATVTTGSAHGLQPGAVVILVGQVPTAYSGTYTVVSVPSTTTFTYVHGNTTLGATTTQGTYTVGLIQPGQLCALTWTLVGGSPVATVAPYAGTANTGIPLGVSLIGLTVGQFGWIQVQGVAIVLTAGAPAANGAVYTGTSGAITPTAAAGKQILGATYASAVSQVIGTGTAAVTLTSTQALVYLSRPSAQSQIT
jgi:hypothetical protein